MLLQYKQNEERQEMKVMVRSEATVADTTHPFTNDSSDFVRDSHALNHAHPQQRQEED
jgi:hypothetical protein